MAIVRAPMPPSSGSVATDRITAPAREAGSIIAFSATAFRYAPGALRYFAEILRQCSMLIAGSLLVLVLLVGLIGGECSLFFVYLTRPLGGTDFTGFFEVPCGIRELFPYMFGYIFSAKVGCGLVAEIGSMRISDEIDGMESVGIDPMRYVIGTRLVAVLMFVPLAFMVATIGGVVGGWLVSVVQIGELTGARYFQGYWQSQGLSDTAVSLLKTMTMAVGISLVGMYYGFKASGGPVGVGNAVARSMILNLILVHAVGAFWSAVFYGNGANYPIGG
jgi:phospholipid/cholesterol/gamma-HCH transport system permease protein